MTAAVSPKLPASMMMSAIESATMASVRDLCFLLLSSRASSRATSALRISEGWILPSPSRSRSLTAGLRHSGKSFTAMGSNCVVTFWRANESDFSLYASPPLPPSDAILAPSDAPRRGGAAVAAPSLGRGVARGGTSRAPGRDECRRIGERPRARLREGSPSPRIRGRGVSAPLSCPCLSLCVLRGPFIKVKSEPRSATPAFSTTQSGADQSGF